MKFSLSFILLCLSLSVERVYGWGMKGHEAVGYAASDFLAPEASSFVETSLSGPQYHSSLGFAAPWADEVRRQKGYAWSAPLHFVDAEDQPPTECSVNQKRDCAGNGCILTAIANYTSRVVDTSLSDSDRQEALKFIGFIGDIGQPLHVEGIERGGNGIHVQCAGKKNNLHSVHDGIINKLLDDNYDGSVIQWVNSLTERIQTGEYQTSASNWIVCEPGSNFHWESVNAQTVLEPSLDDTMNCPLVWAKESNAYDCSFVWTYDSYEDLCSDDNDYYSGAVPIIEMQIAKQGYRLAAWLNVLFDGKTNLP
ncbi:S1/P1 nuclease [Lentinula edodes]|uniref:S1/P1 nuclease n=1 Tax=Lentinula lateritia TaxID=40482 RepID=A0A9W9DIZ0_9AGAR|nr:S1/P1 nuclease [Lentinula edodes]